MSISISSEKREKFLAHVVGKLISVCPALKYGIFYKKTAILLVLATGQRVQTLSLIDINNIKAGEVLAEVWNNVVIDNHRVVAEFIESDDIAESFVPDMPYPQWYIEHVRESQYFLQIVKCDDRVCCGPLRSSLICSSGTFSFSSTTLPDFADIQWPMYSETSGT
ncbi:hypothetical protein HW555_000446 [Spodoptera exigua]|uniref:Uncharacterized protein n=1 Tax=Spodoptera exigua TaxID=7107 RepID=A0A835GU43_SPOEX|nr:hypothetical protein HW555_000446 [Spodoptera exigua]